MLTTNIVLILKIIKEIKIVPTIFKTFYES